uniref:Putative LRR receptor-like protein kinase n=1 Tax=Tanacetum cinerariifolium TaxID=118510 RepID=A0A699GYX7_TANCI|nr:putative LRR receptor-like protein kinase [Tanacetum cinerariifolium]
MHLWHTPLQVLILRELKNKLETGQKEKDVIQLTVEKLENASKSLNKVIDSQIVDNCKNGLGYNAVSPPHTGLFMPPKPDLSYIGLEEFTSEPAVETLNAKTSKEVPKGNPQQDLQEKGVIDSGCSRHMTGNMSYRTYYEEINEGYVAFRGNTKGGKITGKDESRLWHKRLGHLNFKTMNNLVKGNLSLMKKTYCLVVTDDYNRFTWVFFLSTKDETGGILKSFITRIENLVDHKVKAIRCDNGTEFKNRDMNQFYEINGIMRQYSVARTPQQNGVAEKRNITLIEAARTMLTDLKLPTTFWAEVVNTACYVQNKLFDIDTLTKTMNYQPVVAGTQFNGNAEPKSSQDTGFKPSNDVGKKVNEDPRQETECKDQEEKDSVNNTNRVNVVSLTVNVASNEVNAVGTKSSIGLLDDPYMPELEDINILKTQMKMFLVFRNKLDKRGIMIRNMARLVAQGYTQEEGIEYDEVFAPVAKIEAIRLFLAYASFKDFVVYQIDVKSAFLYEKIKEEVYVCQPQRFEDPDFPDKVYKVEKALYGLHQASRAWPDIMFAVYACARYQVNPKVSHLLIVKRIFRYLKGQPKLGLWYPKESPFDLMAYTDSDYAGASLDKREGFEQIEDFLNEHPIRFIQTFLDKQIDGMPTHKEKYNVSLHTKKVFVNMKRIGTRFFGKETRLFPTIVGLNQIHMGKGSTQPTDSQHTPTFDMPPPKPKKTQKPRHPKRKTTKVPQPNESTDIAADEAVYKEGAPRHHGDTSAHTRVISAFDDGTLDKEDTSKHRMIDEMDADEDIALQVSAAHVTTAIADILVSNAETMVTTSPTITAESTKTNVEVTRAPKRKGVMIQHPEETTSTKTASSQQPHVQDKDIQEKVDVDYQLTERLQAEEQQELNEEKKDKLFMELLKKRRKFFPAKRNEEKRNRLPTKTQQRSLMCTYLKNMDGWKPKALKNKSFTEVQELFDKAMKRINTFVDFRTELVEETNGDDVTIDATPLSTKSPIIVDYKIYKEGKKSYFQIFRANEKMDQDAAHMISASKVLMLKRGEFEIWRMRIEQYIQMMDYALWDVIENGTTVQKTQVVKGVTTVMPITSVEDKAQRRLEVKARSTLMMDIPNEHQLKFNSIKDAKQLMEAIKKRFGDNAATKKTQGNLLKQQCKNFTASNSEMLDQTFDRLQKHKKYYAKPTNNNLRTTSASTSANKKPEYVKLEDKKDDRKKQDMSKVKCYNCKKEGNFAKDCKKTKDQAWMESNSDSDQEISANMVFMD